MTVMGTVRLPKHQRRIVIQASKNAEILENVQRLQGVLCREFGAVLSYQQVIGIGVRESLRVRGLEGVEIKRPPDGRFVEYNNVGKEK